MQGDIVQQLKDLEKGDSDGAGAASPENTEKALRDALHAISASEIIPATWDLPFGANPHGVFGATPPEMLHQYDLGLLKTTWEGEVQHRDRDRVRMR
jgi:hypothetical protein